MGAAIKSGLLALLLVLVAAPSCFAYTGQIGEGLSSSYVPCSNSGVSVPNTGAATVITTLTLPIGTWLLSGQSGYYVSATGTMYNSGGFLADVSSTSPIQEIYSNGSGSLGFGWVNGLADWIYTATTPTTISLKYGISAASGTYKGCGNITAFRIVDATNLYSAVASYTGFAAYTPYTFTASDYQTLAQFWGFGFTTVLMFWYIAHAVSQILKAIRKG